MSEENEYHGKPVKKGGPLGPDAGMFPRHPDLRFNDGVFQTLIPIPTFPDQTALVELVNNLSMDEGLAPAFAPFPIERSAFEKTDTMTESYELPDGTFMAYYSLLAAYRSGCLPEASSDADVSCMQVACKPRQVTQWWLINNGWWQLSIQDNELPTLISADGNSRWIASYDVEPKKSFWETSMGKCLLRAEAIWRAKR